MRLINKAYLAVILCIAAIACNRIDPISDAGRISVTANVAATKSMLTGDDFNTTTKVKVYDILLDGAYTKHINGDIGTFVAADSPWKLANEPTDGYSWRRADERLCDHNFFGWLTTDKDGLTPASVFGSDLSIVDSATPGVFNVNVPQTTMTLATPQFDFSISDVITRDVKTANYSMVDLNLKHFFTAFGIRAHNYESDAITITSVKMYGIKNTKSAVITYDTNTKSSAASVSYSNAASSWAAVDSGLELLAGDIVLDVDEEANNVITCAAGGSKSKDATDAYYLMWPQTYEEFASEYDASGNLEVDYSKAILAVTYKTSGGAPVTKYVSLCPLGQTHGWDAGTCHKIELSFTNKFVNLTVSVLPWLFLEKEIDFNKQIACNSDGTLKFVEGTYVADPDPNSHRIYFKNSATPIRGYFSLATPKNGSWMISKVGDFDAFEIDNEAMGVWGDKVDFAYGTIDGTSTAYFTIYPKDQNPYRDYSLKLAFAVRTTSGEVISADEIVQGTDATKYTTIVLQSMN